MSWPAAPMEVVFLTNFSDTCFRAIPSIAQMVDDLSVHLTILHTYNPAKRKAAEAEAWLRSFFPEADRYQRAKRLVVPGHPVEALKRLACSQQVDLALCPGSDSLGLPRIGQRALRGRVVHECGVPVWTIGRGVDPLRLTRPVRNVGCWMEYAGDAQHVEFAAEYASKLGAQLHLLHVLPEVHDGMILPSLAQEPMHPEGIRDSVTVRLGRFPIEPLIHVHGSSGRRSRAALTKAHDIDVLFTSVSRSPLTDWVYSDFHSIDRCPCPVVSISRDAKPQTWNLQRGAAHEAYLARTRALA